MTTDPDPLVRVVWWRLDEADAAAMAHVAHWLSAGEAARCHRFRFEKDRRTFLASRILLRQTLSDATGLAPSQLQFSTDVHGVKPRLVTGQIADAGCEFSLTHTEGLVACAVTRVGEVGLDAEAVARAVTVTRLAPRVLSADESAALSTVADAHRTRRFLEYWCVKEAWLKAMGTGLLVSPATVEVAFDDRGDVRLLAPEHDRQWHVQLLDGGPGHIMALAAGRQADSRPPRLVTEAFVPPWRRR